jgi:sugar phosphate permease
VTPLVAGTIMLAFGWRAIFYIFGSMGVVWALAFNLIYRNTPEEHRAVNPEELAQIRGSNPDGTIRQLSVTRKATPWKRILGSPNMWYIAVGYCCFFFGTNFYLTWYPTYLREYRHLTLQALGIMGSLPLFAGMAGDLFGGSMSDMVFRRTGNAKFARRIVAAPGFLLAAAFLIPAAMTSNTWTCILFLAASFFCLEWVIGPAWAVPMDVGGEFSGTVTGIMNGTGALFGASLTPLVYGIFFEKGSWVAPFFINAGVFVMGALIWTLLINPERSVVDHV